LKNSSNMFQAINSTKKNNSHTISIQPEQLQKLFDALPTAIVLVDVKGRIQFMNQAAYDLLGKPPKSLKLEDWPQKFGLYLDDGRTLYPGKKLLIARALQGEAVEESEDLILRKTAIEHGTWISISTSLLRDENGNIEGGLAMIRNVSYRKQIEASRERQIQRIEALYKLSHIIAEANNDFKEITQLAARFPAEEIGEISIVTLLTSDKNRLSVAAFHDEDPTGRALLRKYLIPETEFDLAESLAGGVIQSEEPLLIPSITPEQLQAISLPLFKEIILKAEVGSVLIVPLAGRGGMLGTINLFRRGSFRPFSRGDQSFLMDIAYRLALAIENCHLFDSLKEEIAKRLSTKQELAISQERFRSIFESASLGIKVLDLDGNILQTNPAFQEMLGYTDTELTGQHFQNFIHPDDTAQAQRLFLAVKNKGVSNFRFEHRTMHKNQTPVWAKTSFAVVRKGEEDHVPAFVVGIVENVSEQKRRDLEMAELKERLQNSMELERLRLAQELHDNPMQALYSATYRIEEMRAKAEPPFKESLGQIKDTIQNVLTDLRATAKELRPPTLSSFGLENAIRSHVHDLQEKHPEIKFTVSLAHDKQMLPDNVRLALYRVLQQSLANVMRHAEATEVNVRFQFDAEEAHLEVTDNGKGFDVPPTWIDFVRHEHYGLAGAAERISAVGGTLRVTSERGKFTTVQAIIPLEDARIENHNK
jgi:PAS domain S-box-containing protein